MATRVPASQRKQQQNRPQYNLTGIEIGLSQRISIFGGTGDGKTTLALYLLGKINPQKLVVVNAGADEKLYEIFGESRSNIDSTFPMVQHVTPFVTENPKKFGRLIWPIVQEGLVYSFYDELSLMATANSFSPAFQYHYQQGRRRGCGLIGVSQRIYRIPPFVFQMSDHVFAGNVQGDDLKRLEDETHQNWGQLMAIRKQHQFAYYTRHKPEPPRFIN